MVTFAGRRIGLRPGSLIGRLSTCTLRIQDVRVSEAHALVTLRGRDLTLLALRGALQVDGIAEDAVLLAKGQRVELAPDVAFEVEEVVLPTRVMVLLVDGVDLLEPCAAVHALLPSHQWVPAWRPDALAHVWSADGDWMIQVDGRVERATPGASWVLDGATLSAAVVDLERLATEVTHLAGQVEAMEVIGRTDTAELRRAGREPVTLDGLLARLVTELGLLGTPTPWDVVAREIWPEAPDLQRRRSFDRVLQRLRQTLREHGVREDLVRAVGRGSYELHLGGGGRFVDEA